MCWEGSHRGTPFFRLCDDYLSHVATCPTCAPSAASLTEAMPRPGMCESGRRLHRAVCEALDQQLVGRAKTPPER
jgi:hypothetical protein